MTQHPLPVHVIVIAKEPIAGRVKTRLCPPLTLEQAADLALASLMDTMHAVEAAHVAARSIILDGAPGPWIPRAIQMIPQRTGPFADRLAGAVDDAFAALALPVLLIGMDTPQVSAALLDRCANSLLEDGNDTVLGLAADGGFWVIGTRVPVTGMFDAVPMSTAATGARQHQRLNDLGLSCAIVPSQRDVDELADALAVASHIPNSRFAQALNRIVREKSVVNV